VIGQVIGNYRLIRELGQGGMGVVYVAEHTQLGRPAALKMLLPQFSSDEAIVQRFFNEARAASAIDHPGIVEIYDFGKHTDGRAYIVMALLKGETLQERIAREPLAPIEGATIVAQVASALAVAHARGIVHRDLKPDNIFLVPNEMMPGGLQAKLLDFGIAKLADDRASFKTQTGSLIGTPAYMSPEQCMGRADLDHRTDLYALGCILFHVLCGRPPFVSEAGAGPLIAAHLRDAAPDPRTLDPYISEPLAAIVRRLLEKDPAARFQTATELRDALMNAGANVSVTRQMETQPTTGPRAIYRGPEAYHATTAPTTSSGSAAQVMTPAKPASKAGVWIGVGVVAIALAGIVTYVAVSTKDEPAPVAVAVAEQPAAPPTQPAPPDSQAVVEVIDEPCPVGQTRSDDTKGHCCWPEQAWSTSKARCIGAPRCPEGTIAKADTCTQKPVAESTAVVDAEPRFVLDKQTYAPGETIRIAFAQPVPSLGTRRAWVTIVEAGRSPESYGGWEFLPDKARAADLTAPMTAGEYEVRIHTDYSMRAFNLRHSVRFTVSTGVGSAPQVTPLAKQRFALARTRFKPRETIAITFPTPMRAVHHERFWITVVAADASDTTYGQYEYVADKATSVSLSAPVKPGDYEVRLHANYPRRTTNVVFRTAVEVR
jgi:serine/threonine-protein kinase